AGSVGDLLGPPHVSYLRFQEKRGNAYHPPPVRTPNSKSCRRVCSWGAQVLMEWINSQLHHEHIVVRSLEEDMFDGLILHHLFQKLAGLTLAVEEIALTASSQRRKLELVLMAINGSLGVEEQEARWSVEAVFSKDLLATLHLLVALATHFQPSLPLPADVKVEVITQESTRSGLKSEKSTEQLTGSGSGSEKDEPSSEHCAGDKRQKGPSPECSVLGVVQGPFCHPSKKVPAHPPAPCPPQDIIKFVNQKLDRLGLTVQNLDTQGVRLPGAPRLSATAPLVQFADGVILLLLIGQLEGFFLHLKEFHLMPSSTAEKVSF
ncbi:Gamma-parvin, partial [Galemys pyrenaicus]